MAIETKQEKFIRRVTQPGAGYTKLVLVQVMVGGGESKLQEYTLDREFGYDESTIANIAAELIGTAQDDADGSSRPNTYCIKAMKGAARGERGPIFRLRNEDGNGESEDSDMLGSSEPSNAAGLLAQLMRHNEANQRISAIKDENLMRAMTDTIKTLTLQNQHYADKHWEVIERAEDLANEKESREIARTQALGRERRLDDALRTIKPLVPIAIAKLKGVPEAVKPTLKLEAIKQVIKGLTPDQMEQMLGILGPQAYALGELFLEANAEDVAADEAENVKTH